MDDQIMSRVQFKHYKHTLYFKDAKIEHSNLFFCIAYVIPMWKKVNKEHDPILLNGSV